MLSPGTSHSSRRCRLWSQPVGLCGFPLGDGARHRRSADVRQVRGGAPRRGPLFTAKTSMVPLPTPRGIRGVAQLGKEGTQSAGGPGRPCRHGFRACHHPPEGNHIACLPANGKRGTNDMGGARADDSRGADSGSIARRQGGGGGLLSTGGPLRIANHRWRVPRRPCDPPFWASASASCRAALGV
jgi:hypothetical protein